MKTIVAVETLIDGECLITVGTLVKGTPEEGEIATVSLYDEGENLIGVTGKIVEILSEEDY